MALSIVGMGYDHATTVIDNRFLEDLDIGTNEQWIVDKIGIITRLSSLPLEYIRETRNQDPREGIRVAQSTATDHAERASRMALERAGISADQIGMVLCNCCTPNSFVPTEGQRLAARLGIHGKVFDAFSACPAFALHIDLLRNYREETLPDFVLCVSTATLTQHVNYNERSDGAIWGDGASAWIVSTRHPGKIEILHSTYTSDPSRCDAVVVETYGHFHQDGRAVRDFSVRQTVRLLKQMEEQFGIDWERDIFVGHQANATMLDQITGNREIPPHNHWHNVTKIGNQAGAGAPAVLAMHWDQIKPGQKIASAVVGAGLSWGSVLMEGR